MALYPETSPTAPVSRDDLAAILAMQQMQGTQGMLGDPNYQGHSPAASDAVVGGPFGGRGGQDREGFGEGIADPALGSPTLAEPDTTGAVSVGPFGRGGDDTSAQSQAAQGRDAAAMAAAAQGRGDFASFGLPGGGYAGFQSAGSGQIGAGRGNALGGMNNGLFPSSSFAPASPNAPGYNPDFDTGGLVTGIMDQVTGSRADLNAMTGAPASPNAPGYNPDFDTGGLVTGIMDQVTGSRADLADMTGSGRGGVVSGGGGGRGGGAGGGFDTAGAVGSIMGAVSGSMADLGAMTGGGGFSGFGATGGYEGSASMSNTGGAQGFGGGAVGGFGGGSGGVGSGGGGEGGGGGSSGGGGGGSDPGGSSPGGVG